MAIRYRAAQNLDPNAAPLTDIHSSEPTLLPDILAPGNGESAITIIHSSGGEILTEIAPLVASLPTPTSTTPTITPSSTPSQTSAPATSTPAPSHGLTPGKLTAAIVVPIAFLAIVIPIIVFSCLSRRRRTEEREYALQRESQRSSREREYMAEKQQRYSAPARPQRPEGKRKSIKRDTLLPTTRDTLLPTTRQPTRHSLGLFNFELSPQSSPSRSSTHGLSTPNFRFSIAQALEMRRSEVAVVQSVNRPSAESGESAQPRNGDQEFQQPMIRGNRYSSASFYDPPPPYASPRPSNAQAQTSLFAPLERIGTQRVADRRSYIARQLNIDTPLPNLPNNSNLNPSSQHNRASSEVLQSLDAYGRVRIWSDSSTSSSGVSRMSAHNNGPFSYGLPERLSDVSYLSFDPSQWTTEHPRQSDRASVISAVTDSDESSTMHPHQII
ncbi:hypothetical protein OEA41_001687 [Lepraria neglecta]|uniref:Uncharacterized protein n=1 Tax=Lepraria neglecta TaxID=209136 RepID=A0AAD9ZA61_9LECA|nr:hypothetical protein OEA41_001687 [Lepraria neglecta]